MFFLRALVPQCRRFGGPQVPQLPDSPRDIVSGSVPGGGVYHCCSGDSSAAACAARPLMLQGPLWGLWSVLPLYS